MKTYQVDLTSGGIGLKGLVLFTIAVILQIVFYALFGLICFFVGLIMFMIGGFFGRTVQKHYNQNRNKDLVGVPYNKQYLLWYRKLVATVFPFWWVMDGMWYHGSSCIIGFCCLHLTGGKVW